MDGKVIRTESLAFELQQRGEENLTDVAVGNAPCLPRWIREDQLEVVADFRGSSYVRTSSDRQNVRLPEVPPNVVVADELSKSGRTLSVAIRVVGVRTVLH